MSAGQLFTLPRQVPLSSAAGLLAGAKLYFYQTATSTPLDVYQDRALTTLHANPVVADGNGVFAAIWLGITTLYRVTLKTSANVTLTTDDDVGPRSASDLTAPTLAGNNVFTGVNKLSAAEVRLILDETDGGTDKRLWDFDIQAGILKLRTRTDADGSGIDIFTATRGSGTAMTSIALGQATTIGGNSVPTMEAGTFAPAWTGFSAAPSGNAFWTKFNTTSLTFCILSFGSTSASSGTSNTTGMSITNIPATIYPSTDAGPRDICYLTDNTVTSVGGFGFTTATTMLFFLGTTPSSTGFTNSGTKGLRAFTSLMWAF